MIIWIIMVLKTNQLFNSVRCHSTSTFTSFTTPSSTWLPCSPCFSLCNNQGDDDDDKDDDVEEEEDGDGDVEVEEVDSVVPVQPALSKTHVGIEAWTSWKQILKDGNSSGAHSRKTPASARVEQELWAIRACSRALRPGRHISSIFITISTNISISITISINISKNFEETVLSDLKPYIQNPADF